MTADDAIGHAIDPAALLDHSQDLVAVVDADSAVRYANAAVRRVLGHHPDELGRLLDLVHADDRELAELAFAELLGDDAFGLPVRVRVRHADGSWRWIEMLGDDRRHDPRIGGAVLSGRDVTSVVEAADADLRRRGADGLLARLAARMVAASADDLDEVMGAVLADLASATGATRSWIFRFDGERMVRTHRWVAPGAPAVDVESFAGRELAHLLGDAREGTPAVVTLGDLPDGELVTAARRADVRSVLVVPLVSHDGPTGLLGVQAEGAEVRWTDDAVHLVGAVGPLVGATLERVGAERALASSEARLRALLRHTSEGVRLLDASLHTVWASPWAESLHGTGHHVADPAERLSRIHPDDRDAVLRTRSDVLERPGVPHVVRFRLETPEGAWRHLEEVATNLLHDPDVAGVVVNTRDVTERHRHEHQLLDQARRDPLTGLPNRRHLHDLLDAALERSSGRDVVTVVFIDLDRFKLVNDSLGHHVGDALLVEAAARLRAAVRADDVVARLGGDEFVVMCEGLDAVDELADRVLDAFRRPFRIGAAEVYTTASVGVASARPGDRRTDVLRDADAAMYAAKEAGRNQRAVFSGHLVERARHRLELESGLRRAVSSDELDLHWQPIVDERGAPVGIEALLRWVHPERGLLPPDAFIEVAEDTGLIVPVGAWALREACERWAARRRTGEVPALDLHVNVSVRQLVTPGMVDLVVDVLERTGLDPAELRLEITESALLAGEVARDELDRLVALGLHLALDDFGTGYSSLSRLRRLQIDTVKIDRSFVSGVAHDPDDVAIVSAVVQLAHILGVEVVAEGVETPTQAAALHDLGCRRSQGFLHAPPLPLDAALRWIAGHGRPAVADR